MNGALGLGPGFRFPPGPGAPSPRDHHHGTDLALRVVGALLFLVVVETASVLAHHLDHGHSIAQDLFVYSPVRLTRGAVWTVPRRRSSCRVPRCSDRRRS